MEIEEAVEQTGELINLKASGRVEDDAIVIEGTIDVPDGARIIVVIERIGSWALAGQTHGVAVNDGYFKLVTTAHNLSGDGVRIWVSFMFTEPLPNASMMRDALQKIAIEKKEQDIESQPGNVVELYGKEGENIIDDRIVECIVTQ